jgi:hypothetical protein
MTQMGLHEKRYSFLNRWFVFQHKSVPLL